jgi:hypothetical protein
MFSFLKSLIISALICLTLSFFIDSVWKNYFICSTLTISILFTFFQVKNDKDLANALLKNHSDALNEIEESGLLIKILSSSPSIVLSKTKFVNNIASLEFSTNTLYFSIIAYLKSFYDIYDVNFVSLGYVIFLLFIHYYFGHNYKFYYNDKKRDLDNIKRNYKRMYGKANHYTDFLFQWYFDLLVETIQVELLKRKNLPLE